MITPSETYGGGSLLKKLKNYFKDATVLIEPKDSSIMPIKLDITGNENLSLQSDVTDNYVEANVAYQDHITKKPMVYTVEGEVGELVWYKQDSLESVLGAVEAKLTTITTFLPSVSKKMYSVMDKATKAINFVDSVDNFVSRFAQMTDSNDEDTQQKKAYKRLFDLWSLRIPINIHTPWRNLQNFVITNIEFSQSSNTKDKTRIRISFKEFRQTSLKDTTAFNINKYQGRAFEQKSEQVSLGTTTGSVMTKQMCKANQFCPISSDGSGYGTFWN